MQRGLDARPLARAYFGSQVDSLPERRAGSAVARAARPGWRPRRLVLLVGQTPRLAYELGPLALKRVKRSLERRTLPCDARPRDPDGGCEQQLDVLGRRRGDLKRRDLARIELKHVQGTRPALDRRDPLRAGELHLRLALAGQLPGRREPLGGCVQRRARTRSRGVGDPHRAPQLALAHQHRARAMSEIAQGVAPGDRLEAGRELVAQGRRARRQAGGAGYGVDLVESLAGARLGMLEGGCRRDELDLGADELRGGLGRRLAARAGGRALGLDRPSELCDLGDRCPRRGRDEGALLALERHQPRLARCLLLGQPRLLVAQAPGPRGRVAQRLGRAARCRVSRPQRLPALADERLRVGPVRAVVEGAQARAVRPDAREPRLERLELLEPDARRRKSPSSTAGSPDASIAATPAGSRLLERCGRRSWRMSSSMTRYSSAVAKPKTRSRSRSRYSDAVPSSSPSSPSAATRSARESGSRSSRTSRTSAPTRWPARTQYHRVTPGRSRRPSCRCRP